MKKTDFIPKAKLSKKKRQELNRAKRITWDHSPVTRVIPSKKKEKQEKASRSDQTASDWFFDICHSQREAVISVLCVI